MPSASASTSALVTLSHSPLMAFTEPAAGTRARVEEAFAGARAFIADFAPDLVVLFGPDHYNGFFYELMPPFCIGAAARTVGDYDTPAGELSVDREAALTLARGALADDVDVAISERMVLDHGFAQPLQILFGGLRAVPLVPVFLNCVAVPLGPARRARALGRALGRAASALTPARRVLFVGSGGLSHDPPMPSLTGASPELIEQLVAAGRTRTADQRAARQERVIQAGREAAAGKGTLRALSPEWDRQLLAVLASGDLSVVDSWSTEWFVERAGGASHEARTSIAAYAALGAAGPYRVVSSFYEPIPAWVAGFAVTTALPR